MIETHLCTSHVYTGQNYYCTYPTLLIPLTLCTTMTHYIKLCFVPFPSITHMYCVIVVKNFDMKSSQQVYKRNDFISHTPSSWTKEMYVCT